MKLSAFAALALLIAASASAGIFSDCDQKAPRSVATPSGGLTRIVIVGRAGSLRVEGRSGAGEVRASGTACASSGSLLADVQLRATRSGSELRIEAEIPDNLFNEEAALDFTVIVPSNVAVSIHDGSGDLDVLNTGTTEIIDGSGDLAVKGVNGNLSVRDGSGDMQLSDIAGDVRITDGSGGIDVKRANSVTIDADGSGEVEIVNVKRNVTILVKGSGDVHVADVGGDFTVQSKGSGRIDNERVAGRLSLPR
jgi:DUF4097 and DUF4098 domain-containing protein YvlB